MAASPAEPDWNLLPHDPVQFFGLEPGFDRRALKRRYNELIRQFKPERFPQEFQRIRAAYEQLDEAVRYGQSTDPVGPTIDLSEWMAQGAAQESGAERAGGGAAAPVVIVPLHERVRTGSVSALYRELQERADKTPCDYYALAVISDVVDRQDGQQFAQWLLKGLTAFPNEIGLSTLLHSYFKSGIPAEHCEALLVQCSKIVREDLFFPLTDAAWRMLLRTEHFSHFRNTLEECEKNLKGVNIDNRLAFYLQILRAAVWVADADWIQASFEFIEKNFDRIPSFLDYDVEILSRLRAYIRVREAFLRNDDVRRQIDAAMRDYFSEDQLTGDKSVLACQVLMTQEGERLGAAFADVGNPTYPAFFAVWLWITYDVHERHVEPPKEALDERVWHQRTLALLDQIEQQTRTSRPGIKWATRRVVYRASQAAALLLVSSVVCFIGVMGGMLVVDYSGMRSTDDGIVGITGILGMCIGIFLGFWICRQITKRYWEPFTVRVATECYQEIWQREIINFLARSHLPYQTLRAFVHSFPNTVTSRPWVKHFVDVDYALPVFAIAQRFVV